ncbi:MAG: hypothetical protein MZV63_55715 [Marinilabiliales bacterium]|nr:hypothetical protein [Marinilabiliales bacterium]
MRSQADYLVRTFFLSVDKVEYIKDTVAMGTNYKGDILIPMMFGGGFSVGKKDKWTAGIDGKWQNWEKFTAFGMSDSLVNSYRISAGAEIIPDKNGYGNYLKRIRYRVGFMYQGHLPEPSRKATERIFGQPRVRIPVKVKPDHDQPRSTDRDPGNHRREPHPGDLFQIHPRLFDQREMVRQEKYY